jgi:hypothetical protein
VFLIKSAQAIETNGFTGYFKWQRVCKLLKTFDGDFGGDGGMWAQSEREAGGEGDRRDVSS